MTEAEDKDIPELLARALQRPEALARFIELQAAHADRFPEWDDLIRLSEIAERAKGLSVDGAAFTSGTAGLAADLAEKEDHAALFDLLESANAMGIELDSVAIGGTTLRRYLQKRLRESFDAGESEDTGCVGRFLARFWPDLTDPLLILGRQAIIEKNAAEAVGWLSRGLALDPGSLSIRFNLARALGEVGRLEEAAECLEVANADPQKPLDEDVRKREWSRLIYNAILYLREAAREYEVDPLRDTIRFIDRLVAEHFGDIETFLGEQRNPRNFRVRLARGLSDVGRTDEAVTLLENGLADDEGGLPLHQILGAILIETSTDLERAIGLLEKRLDIGDPTATLLLLSDAYNRLGRHGEALEAARKAAAHSPENGSVKNRLVLYEAHEKAEQAASDATGIRHIAILGTAYCGSTFLGSALGSIPGVANIGESHWMIKSPRDSGALTGINFDSDAVNHLTKCGCHGVIDCPVFSLDFRREMAADTTDWYFKLARRMESEIIVSSDKTFSVVTQMDPLQRYDSITLFKSPDNAWKSMLRRKERFRDSPDARIGYGSVHGYVRIWTRTYANFLKHQANSGKQLFLCWDDFTRNPVDSFNSLSAALELDAPKVEGQIEIAPGQRAFGGNAAVNVAVRKQEGKVAVSRDREKQKISDSELAFIAENSDAQEVFRALKEQSDRLLAS